MPGPGVTLLHPQAPLSGLPTALHLSLPPNFHCPALLALIHPHRARGKGVRAEGSVLVGGGQAPPHRVVSPSEGSLTRASSLAPLTFQPLPRSSSSTQITSYSFKVPPPLTLTGSSTHFPATPRMLPSVCQPSGSKLRALPSSETASSPTLPQPLFSNRQPLWQLPPSSLMCLYSCTCLYLPCIWWCQYLPWHSLPYPSAPWPTCSRESGRLGGFLGP